jgi:hypothetical protein
MTPRHDAASYRRVIPPRHTAGSRRVGAGSHGKRHTQRRPNRIARARPEVFRHVAEIRRTRTDRAQNAEPVPKVTPMAASAPPGWYENPSGEGNLRYWDGSTWTDHYHDKHATGSSVEPLTAAPSSLEKAEDRGEWDPDEVWAATGKPLTGIGAGRYKLTKFYLFFEKGMLRTNAQQVPVAALLDIDVRQSMSQKARGVGDIVVHIQRSTGVEIVTLEDIPNFREGQRALNEVSAAARAHIRASQNTTTVNYQGAPPFAASQGQPASTAQPERPVVPPVDYVAQLEKLGQLRDAGVLTEGEFQAKKEEILRRI